MLSEQDREPSCINELTYSLVHGAEYYMESWLALSFSKNVLMEPEDSLPCSQNPATGPYPKPAKSSFSHRSLSPEGPS
jgi:hypothetical protein